MGYDRKEQVVAKEDLVLQDSCTSSDVSHAEIGVSCNGTIQDMSNSHSGTKQGGCIGVGIQRY